MRFRAAGGKRFFSLYNLESVFARKKENMNNQKSDVKIVYNYPRASMAAVREAMISVRVMLGTPSFA